MTKLEYFITVLTGNNEVTSRIDYIVDDIIIISDNGCTF